MPRTLISANGHARVLIPRTRRKTGPPVVIPVFRSVFHFHRPDGTVRLSREEWRTEPASADKVISAWGAYTHTGCKTPICRVECPPETRPAGITHVFIPSGRRDGKVRLIPVGELLTLAQVGQHGCRFVEEGREEESSTDDTDGHR